MKYLIDARAIVVATAAILVGAACIDHLRLDQRLGMLEERQAKHAWPDLTYGEKAALAGVLKTLPPATKFDIVCNTASCDELAEDIDDAIEAAGLDSALDHAAGPLGYGVAVQVNEADRAAAEAAIAALARATAGRLSPPLVIAKPGQNPPGYVTIIIGKYRAPVSRP